MIVAGGPHATSFHESLLHENSVFDFVIKGSGEQRLYKLIQHLEYGESLDIDGIFSKDAEGIEPKILNFDQNILFDFTNIEINQYFNIKKELPIITTKGCPYQCRYCSIAHYTGNNVMRKKISFLKKELELYIKKYQCKSFQIVSENITGFDKTYFKDLLFLFKSQDINWRAQLKVEELNLIEINSLSNSGCYELIIGVDAVSLKAQQLSNRYMDKQKLINNIKLLIQKRISVQAIFILGFPNEDLPEICETVELANNFRKMGINNIVFFPLMYFPGTSFWKEYSKKMYFGAIPVFNSVLMQLEGMSSYMSKYPLVPEISHAYDKTVKTLMGIVGFSYSYYKEKNIEKELSLYLSKNTSLLNAFDIEFQKELHKKYKSINIDEIPYFSERI